MKPIFKSEEGKAEIVNFYNNQLLNWQCPHQEHNIETSIGETFVIECGETHKPAVVLLHGSGTNSLMWLDDMVTLSEHFHVYAIDIPGECGKSAGNRPAWAEGHYAKWLNELFQKLNIKKASLIGNSTGGWIALDFSFDDMGQDVALFGLAGRQATCSAALMLVGATILMAWQSSGRWRR